MDFPYPIIPVTSAPRNLTVIPLLSSSLEKLQEDIETYLRFNWSLIGVFSLPEDTPYRYRALVINFNIKGKENEPS